MGLMLLYIALGVSLFCSVALLFVPMLLRPSPEAQRILAVVESNRPDVRVVGQKERLEEVLLRASRALRARFGLTISTKLRERLHSAGYRDDDAADMFFAGQCMSPLLGAFGGSFVPVNTLFWVGALAMVGFIAPDMWLTHVTKKRKNRIRRSIPDAIDLLVICVEAGLGLDQALLRVGSELGLSHPDIQEELQRVHQEQRAGRPRLEAWESLAKRTKIDEFAMFVNMLTQTDRFGTPIIKALVRFSDDLRMKRRQRAEEAAAKTKIKIIFPLVFFIFPCLFIVLLAPALISIGNGLKGMNH